MADETPVAGGLVPEIGLPLLGAGEVLFLRDPAGLQLERGKLSDLVNHLREAVGPRFQTDRFAFGAGGPYTLTRMPDGKFRQLFLDISRYPETSFDQSGTTLALAGGPYYADWVEFVCTC